jgi:hypothetical protein
MNPDGVSFDEVHSHLVGCRFLDYHGLAGASGEAILRMSVCPKLRKVPRSELGNLICVYLRFVCVLFVSIRAPRPRPFAVGIYKASHHEISRGYKLWRRSFELDPAVL